MVNYLKSNSSTACMRVHVVDGRFNFGCRIEINQDFLFRGTNYKSFKDCIKGGKYWTWDDPRYGLSTWVATNIGGAVSYAGCGTGTMPGTITAIYDDGLIFRDSKGKYGYLDNRPLLLAIAHAKYKLGSPDDEGFLIVGEVSLDDIVIVKTEKDLYKVLPLDSNFDAAEIQRIKSGVGIFS
jgi:hypothetical protein